MSLFPTIIDAFDIPDAHFKVVKACMDTGYVRPVFRGERKEELRKELDFVLIHIKRPGNVPLFPTYPDCIPPVSSEKAINDYLTYIATPEKAEGEDYTYGNRTHGTVKLDDEVVKYMQKHDAQEGKNIHHEFNQFDVITQFLKETPETNRGVIEVGMARDLQLQHPPCLRYMQFKVRYGKLHMLSLFRSWDVMYGLPMNLGAYQKLKASMVNDLNEHYTNTGMHKIEDGEIVCVSMGAHVYSGQWKYAKALYDNKILEKLKRGEKVIPEECI